ncbi:MAG: DUF1295 domain-containing protein [Candidatus Izemoplasmatales bacterium]|nr:DUF1295 domain-containing protein [Candidatus Izemoplasmatales bacterium]
MSNRTKSLLALLGMYLVAFLAGFLTYLLVSPVIVSPLWRMLAADVVGTIVIWGFGLLVKNASTYDPYWSVVPPLIVTAWILILNVELSFSVALLLIGISFWAIRLTYNWLINWTDFNHQDWRYTMIRNTKPEIWFLSNFFGINMMPTMIVFAQLIAVYHFLVLAPALNGFVILGFMVIIGATSLQFISDRQMLRFRLANTDRKKCISDGLWKYSRHPNYFGEVSVWWGVWLIAGPGSGRFDFLVVFPALMTLLFLFISIPMMEKKMIASRPDYLLYKKQVSMLVPFFPRKEREHS